jgi:hypothetical protein
MLEISIFCVILLAISYWAVLWVMGRREDVLHGEFVKSDAQPVEPVRSVFPGPPARTVFPEKPAIAKKPAITEISVPTGIAAQPVRAAMPEQPSSRQERLESLLNSIKQDLNQLVQK